MAKISQTTNYYEIDGDAGGGAVIQINGNTSTTTITGATSITNGLTVTAGGATISAGGIDVTGGATVSTGNLTVTLGDLAVSAGTITATALGDGLMTSSLGLLQSTATTTGSILLGNAITGFTEIAAGTPGKFPVDSGTVFASVAASGDMTLDGAGAFTAVEAMITGKSLDSGPVSDSDEILLSDGSGTIKRMTRGVFVAGVAGSPGGLNTEIQYNNSGSFGGDSGFTTDGAGALTVTGGSVSLLNSPFTIDSALTTTGFDVDADVPNYQILTTLGTTGASELIIGDTGTQNFTLKVKNLTVDGTLTYIDTTNLRVEDALIDINSTSGGTGVGSNAGAGLNILSLTAPNTITFTAVSDGGPLRSSSGLSVAAATGYDVNGTSVLTATTLGSGVVNSSLTSVGTIGTGTWEGTIIGAAYGGTGANFSASSGAISVSSGTFSAGTLSVGNGGTGATSLTDGGILLGSGSGAITATGQPTDGQLLIGSSGSDPTLATLTAGTGITITNAAGAITIDAAAGSKVTGTYSGVSTTITVAIPNSISGNRTNVAFDAVVYLEDSTPANSAMVTIQGIVNRTTGAPLVPDFTFIVVPGSDGDKVSLGNSGTTNLQIDIGDVGVRSGNYVVTVEWTED